MLRDEEWASWTLLLHGANDLVVRGKRSWEDFEALRRAVQLFKDGQLEGAVPKGLAPDVYLPSIFAFFDTPVESVGLIEEAVALLRGYGIRLVGEILRFKWTFGFKGGDDVHKLFLKSRVPVSTDPWSLGWRPAYLADPDVHAALRRPGSILLSHFNVWDPHPFRQQTYFNGPVDHTTPFVGQAIAQLATANGELKQHEAKQLQTMIARVPELAVLHAAMFVPPEFPAAESDPRSHPPFVEYEERARRARVLLESTLGYNLLEHYGLQPAVWMREKWKPEELRRREIFVAALKAEGMSPHFFAVATHIRKEEFRDTRTVREYLSRTPASLFYGYSTGSSPVNNLAAWGLKLGMTAAELDELFGPETVAAGA
ncbi:hypothetical protein EBS80_01625 [bacterium]|nr:hypothetical protein [bacterium]